MSMINEFVEEIKDKINHKKEYHKNFYEKLGWDLNDNDLHKATQLAFDDCMEIINKLAEEYKDVPDTNAGKWIPVSEKLPDKEGKYLVTLKRWNIVTIANFKNVMGYKHFDNGYVIAWQPLPKPYKGE